MEQLDLVKHFVDIFSALLSPIIAVSVAYIAYQQWKLSADKEKREQKADKLKIYMSVQRFLRNTDCYGKVDLTLYKEFQEALALADFYFDYQLIDWLNEVDSSASSWLNYVEMCSLEYPEHLKHEYDQNLKYMEDCIDRLQDNHCQLLGMFKSRLQ
ncbi:TPA: hypothetical protein ACX6NP_001488 [Photobacterium damselae]